MKKLSLYCLFCAVFSVQVMAAGPNDTKIVPKKDGGHVVIQSVTSGGATTDVVTSDDAGNVGIGTSTPTAKLDVSGTANVSGNVGIGTTAPTTKLDINGTVNTSGNLIVAGTHYFNGEVYWRATRVTANQTIARLTFTTLIYNSLVTGSTAYNVASGVFTAPASGVYLFCATTSLLPTNGTSSRNQVSVVSSAGVYTLRDISGAEYISTACQTIKMAATNQAYINAYCADTATGGCVAEKDYTHLTITKIQ